MRPTIVSVISAELSEVNRALIDFACSTAESSMLMTAKISAPESVSAHGLGDGRDDETDVKPKKTEHTLTMSELNRDELKAHLETQELKVDARLGHFEQRVADGIKDMNNALALLDRDLSGVRGLKGTIILNSVLSVIAIVGIVIGVMAYGTTSFDSGRDTAQLVQELRQQSFENKQMLEQIKQNQKQ